MRGKETHEFTLKAGVGEPLDTDTIADLDRRLLGMLANSDDLTDTFVATYERTGETSARSDR